MHVVDCACCAPTPFAQSLEELDFTRSACYFASIGDAQRVRLIIEKDLESVHSDGKGGTSGYTPAHYAARAGHTTVLDILIRAGANINATTAAGGATPLMRAAFCGHTAAVKLLLDAGADALIQDVDGQTALHKAIEQGHSEVANLLIEHSPELNSIFDHRGRKASDIAPLPDQE